MTMVSPHKGTIMWKMREITNVLLLIFKPVYFLSSSVQLMTWMLLHVLAFHPLERLRWSLALISSLPWDFLHHIYSGDNWCGGWPLMWPFRFMALLVCGLSGLWPFQSVAVSVCGRSGLWPFRIVAVSVCGHSGLWPFRFVAVLVCGRFGCGRFGLWPLWPVTGYSRVTTCHPGYIEWFVS